MPKRRTEFTLAHFGDREEQAAWPLFVRDEFPQYEEFWRLFVVALTGRVSDVREIGFRPQAELDRLGRHEWHVEVAQLHYTTLLHLARVFELRRRRVRDRDSFFEAIVRLDAAADTAFELLGHCLIDRGSAESWNERTGERVRKAWEKKAGSPFISLARYRNSLLHGRVRPEHEVVFQVDRWSPKVPFYPTFEKMPTALDWRKADALDAAPADQLVDEAWTQVLAYFRKAWTGELLPWARASFKAPPVPITTRQGVSNLIVSAGALSASPDAPSYTGGSITHTHTILHTEDPPTGD